MGQAQGAVAEARKLLRALGDEIEEAMRKDIAPYFDVIQAEAVLDLHAQLARGHRVDHGAQAFSLYGNLLDIAVKKGANVEAGQALGTVGATLTGPAGLYFELRVDGQPVDPLQWFKKK